AEDVLWFLRQGGRRLERYVEEFLELANQLSWHDAALGACFHLGLNRETICCDLPVCDYPLIELINLVLYLNASNFEVEKIKENLNSCDPTPSETRHVVTAHPTPGTSTYRTNGTDRLPSPNYPRNILSTTLVLSPEAPAAAHSRTPAMARSSPLASNSSHMYIMDMALPLEFSAPVLTPSSLLSPFLPSSPLVPSSHPESAPPELFWADGPLNFPQKKFLGVGG
ncbi:hypothetical protein M9458_045064, partial [Cirrhinus mrigala]